MHLRARLHTQHHIVRMMILAAQIMRVVRQHQRNLQFLLQPEKIVLNLVLLLQPLVLNLEIEIPAPENILILHRRALGLLIVPAISSSHSSPLRHPEKPISPSACSARYFLLTRGLR